MTKIDPGQNEQQDRVQVMDDEKKRALDLYTANLVPPDVGIFDDPVRCYRINKEWAALVLGFASWLTEIPAWRDATDESYFAIDEVSRFLVGVECDLTDYRLRQKPTDNCILQQSIDAGETWTDVFDFSLCATIQDQSYQVMINNAVNNYIPTIQNIYNNYVSNYTGTPSSVYPELAIPAGDKSAINAAYCNAIFHLVRSLSDNAVAYYAEAVESGLNEFNFFVAISLFTVAAIGLAGAIPTGGASLTLTAMAGNAALVAAGIGLGAGLINYAADYMKNHTVESFQDEAAREEVVCYLVEEVPASANTKDTLLAALTSHPLTGNAAIIADFMAIILSADVEYAAFLEKWANNMEYADAGIELECPCASEYKVWVWNFSEGLGPFTFDTYGTLAGGRVKGTLQADGDADVLMLTMPFNPVWRVRSVKLHTERILGISNGADDYATFKMRPTVGSNTDSFNPIQGGFRPNGLDMRCNVMINPPFYWAGANQIWIAVSVSNNLDDSEIYLDKVEIMFEADFAKGGYITDDDDLCS
jgi:hypothetical protein